MRILYEDAHLLAVVKPAGISTQAPPIAGPTLEWEVRSHLCPEDPAAAFAGTVHRLDRPVSGIVLWAKTTKAARRLSQQFARRQVRKEYWAIVEGRPALDEGTWDDWLIFDDSTGIKRAQVVAAGTPRASTARTAYHVATAVQLPAGTSWLKLWPETGRTHQLRIQAAARGFPILGDALYGAAGAFPEGIALHARSLAIHHPILNQPLTFEADPPETWRHAGIDLGSS
jgi:23S rRNA pseudouridine1911/1915/1917 synthase